MNREAGVAFSSNVGVAEYFRRAHGLDYARWHAEERLEQRIAEESQQEYLRLMSEYLSDRYPGGLGEAYRTMDREKPAWNAAALEKGIKTALAMGIAPSAAEQTARGAMLLWSGRGAKTERQYTRAEFGCWWNEAGGKQAQPPPPDDRGGVASSTVDGSHR